MNFVEKVINLIKNNWKAMLFSVVYVFGFFMMVAFSFGINDYIKGGDYAIFSPLLMCTALLSILSLIAKFILNLIFKEKANDVAKKSSIILIPIGILITITTIGGILLNVGIPFDNSSELSTVMSIFIVPAYFIFLIMMGMFFLLVTFISFALLRFAIKHTKAVIIIFFASSILWFVSLGNIYIPNNFSIGNINNPQTTLQDIISMGEGSYNVVNTFFIHNDKIYAYVFQKAHYNNRGDEFFVVDLQGKNKKVISNSDEIRLAQFIYVDNNEAYYYTMYTNSINKINLETGDISIIFEFKENEGGWWYVQYEQAEQKFYQIKPQFKKATNYKIEDEYYNSYYFEPRTITVKNTKTNKITEHNNVIYWNVDGSILYLLYGEKKESELYYSGNIKNIHVDKIILE